MAVVQQQKKADGTNGPHDAAGNGNGAGKIRLPLQLDPITASTRVLLDKVHATFLATPGDTGPAMYQLQCGLQEVKSKCSPDDWGRVAAECETHPLAQVIWQDPFTRHSYDKPSGYAGDARLLDYLYGVADAPDGTSPVGTSIFGHMMSQQGALGVRARGDVLADLIDETAQRFEKPRILSIACGHLREGIRSTALMNGQVGELVALDQDAGSLAEVERVYHNTPVTTMHCSVRSILSGKVKLEGFHYVYAAGLYDYLSERVAQRLTKLMFDMVVPGGRVLVANFAPGLPEVGYMETFMAWQLIYRTPEEMGRLSADIAGDAWSSQRVFWDASGNIVFLDLVKRAEAKPRQIVLTPDLAQRRFAVPGLSHVKFGPAVRPQQAEAE